MPQAPLPSSVAFTALVMAGSRPGGDPFALAMGVSHKALIPVADVPMLVRVVRTLRAARRVERILLCAIDAASVQQDGELSAALAAGELGLVEGGATPSASVLGFLDSDRSTYPLLVTTADHPLLTAEIVDEFCDRAVATDADVCVGVAPAEIVARTFREGRRTLLRFREGSYCGCNLYAFLTPSARRAAEAWRQVEQHRKRPWRIIGALGVTVLLRFLRGRLRLGEALELASQRIGLRADAVVLQHAEAGFDVDKASDLRIADAFLRRTGAAASAPPE